MYHKKITSQIKFEINQIGKLSEAYQGLFIKCKDNELDIIEITALASVLHSFYNGIEKIFEIIAKRLISQLRKANNSIEIYLYKCPRIYLKGMLL